jgi:hypothetical protein
VLYPTSNSSVPWFGYNVNTGEDCCCVGQHESLASVLGPGRDQRECRCVSDDIISLEKVE